MSGTLSLKIVVFAVFVGLLTLAVPLTSQASSIVPSAEITGVPSNVSCTGAAGVADVLIIYNMPFDTAIVGSMVVDGVGVVANYDQIGTRLGMGYYGFFPTPFSAPTGTHITDTITTYNTTNKADGISYECTLVYECGTGTQVSLNCTAEPEEPPTTPSDAELVPVPGCDMQMNIPSTAVVGQFVADSEVYWTPGQVSSVILPAGKTAWVVGLDSSGEYYKIVWSCDYLWVRADTMGPNYDSTWQGKALPTGVVN